MAKVVQFTLIVKDEKAGDLIEGIKTLLAFAKMDGDLPDHELGRIDVKGVSSKIMSGLTTRQQEDLGMV